MSYRDQGRHPGSSSERPRDSRSRSPTERPRDSRAEDRAVDQRERERRAQAQSAIPAPIKNTYTGELKYSHEVITPDNARVLNYPPFVQRGTLGKPFQPEVNHHQIRALPKVAIYCFDIKIKVADDSVYKGKEEASAQQRARLLLKREVLDFFGDDYVFDGVSQAWSPKQIVQIGEVKQTVFAMEQRRDRQPNNIVMTVTGKGKLQVATLAKYILGQPIELDPAANPDIENQIKWLQACFRKDPESRLVTRPNNNCYFDRIPGGFKILQKSTAGVLEARRGVFQTMQIRFGILTMNIDTATTAFYVPNKCLLDSAAAMANLKLQQLGEPTADARIRASATKLRGMYFYVKHLGARGNATKIKMLSFANGNALTTFFEEKLEGKEETRRTNVNDYFATKYHIKLRYPKLPLVKTTKGEFPLEVCWSAEGERYKELLQGRETAEFIKWATCPAFDRKSQIEEQLKMLKHHENRTLKAHGIVMEPRMMKMNARILDAPRITYAGKHVFPSDGTWNLRGLKFLRPATIKSWAWIYIPSKQPLRDEQVTKFADQFLAVFRNCGMTVPSKSPAAAYLIGNPNGKVSAMTQAAIEKAEKAFGQRPDVIFYFMQGGGPEGFYQKIKMGMDVKLGIVSQCMLQDKSLDKPGNPAQYIANVAMKVNVKLGGTNSTAHNPMYDQEPCMLLGGDISHPTPAQMRNPIPVMSIAALVGTWDKACTAYTCVTGAQEQGYAIIKLMKEMFRELLLRYYQKNNNQFPKHIFYYRDGVSESEFKAIKTQEARAIKDFMVERGQPGCKITLIVAIKRHHTRFFVDLLPSDKSDGPKKIGIGGTNKGNVACGTVVENHRTINDFFLVPHNDLQGTKRPTRYVTVIDENQLSPDQMQMMTYNMCSSYARATRTVAVVPPIYYADQACERARHHIQRDKATGLDVLGEIHPNHRWNMWWQ